MGVKSRRVLTWYEYYYIANQPIKITHHYTTDLNICLSGSTADLGEQERPHHDAGEPGEPMCRRVLIFGINVVYYSLLA